MEQALTITVTVNGTQLTRSVAARQHLVDFLREELGLPARISAASTASAARARCASTATSCAAA